MPNPSRHVIRELRPINRNGVSPVSDAYHADPDSLATVKAQYRHYSRRVD